MASPWDNINPDFGARIRQMIAESGGRITIVSGYRSPARQAQLWEEALDKYGSEQAARNWVAPPGKSNHNKGFAFDLGGDLALAHALAPKYGLVFPMGHEPWHVEPANYRSDPGAYTTDPNAVQVNYEDPNAGTGGGDHVDQLFGKLNGLFGEQGSAGAAEYNPLSVQEGATAEAMGMQGPEDQHTPEQSDLSMATAPPMGATGGEGDIDRFMNAISGQESGGNYNARNTGSGAAGKFQIMPANWPAWSKEAGLSPNAPMTPANQDHVARFKMQQYYKQFGNWGDVAVAWYAGPGSVGKANYGKAQKGGPSIGGYRDSIIKRMGG